MPKILIWVWKDGVNAFSYEVTDASEIKSEHLQAVSLLDACDLKEHNFLLAWFARIPKVGTKTVSGTGETHYDLDNTIK